jgi:hypothetical protein
VPESAELAEDAVKQMEVELELCRILAGGRRAALEIGAAQAVP